MTVSGLWDAVRAHRASGSPSSPIAYEWFVLALDLLYIVKAVEYQDGLIRRGSA
jgi:hypothetical protein